MVHGPQTDAILVFTSIHTRNLFSCILSTSHPEFRSSTQCSLSKILAKQNISVKKADEIQVKVNILKAFVEGPLEEDEEMARDTADL
jgi:hypothetical protein